MGLVKTKGIVTKIVNYSDNDKILTVITADQGKIQVFCKGAQKPKSAILASTEFLAFSEFVLYDGNREMYNLSSADIIEVFFNLRIDLDKLTYATTMAQMMNDVCQEGELSYKKLQLFLNTLYVLSETDKDLDFVFSVFRIRLLALLGFVPRLAACTNCGKKAIAGNSNISETSNAEYCSTNDMNTKYFSIKDNGLKCDACARQDKGAIKMSEVTYTSLIYILSSDPKKIFSFEIPETDLEELKLITQVYTNEKLEKEYKVMKI